jgi:hypothetical protein
MPDVIVSPPQNGNERGQAEVTATITVEQQAHRVFFRCSHGPIADGSAVFVPIAMLPAMKAGAALRAPGPVSLRLLDHLPVYQNIIHAWYDNFHTVAVAATPRIPVPVTAQRGVGCFFSGGIDSFYSVLTHRDDISHLIFIHGYDILLRNTARRQVSIEGVRRAAAELGKQLIEVETNAREMLDVYSDWGRQSHGTVLGAVALLLSPQLRKIYIASTTDYNYLYPWGSHPMLDPLWSNEEVEVIYDGSANKREDKIERLAADDTAMRYLRVCFENTGSAYNCGTCEKCVRTMVELHLAGALQRCATLPHTLDCDQIAHMSLGYRQHWGLRRLLERGAARRDPALEQALQQCLGVYQADYLKVSQGLENQIIGLKRELRHLYASRSWRLTAPLRRVGDATRRLKLGGRLLTR